MGHLQGRTAVKDSFECIVEQLKAFLGPLVSKGTAQMHCVSDTAKEMTVKIVSRHSDGAPIHMILDEDFGAYLTVGRGSIFEIPFEGRRYTQESFTEDVKSLIEGIIKNGFEEEILILGGVVAGASGAIKRGGAISADIRESWRKIGLRVFAKRTREHHLYSPY